MLVRIFEESSRALSWQPTIGVEKQGLNIAKIIRSHPYCIISASLLRVSESLSPYPHVLRCTEYIRIYVHI
jgi:hypothetical protein